MAENVYLKTVNFGGFDKKETLQYIDTLLSDIYRLEAEVKEKDEMISSLESGEVQNFSGKEELEARLDEGKSKISELQASNDTLKLQIANYESDVTDRDSQIASLNNEIEVLKDKLADAEANAAAGGMDNAAYDMGALFIEAKKSADAVVGEAKKAAKKMEDDAKELQNQILEDANTQAASIVENANAQANATISNANAQAEETINSANAKANDTINSANAQASATINNANTQAEETINSANAKAEATLSKANNEAAMIREKSADLRNAVKSEYSALEANVSKLSEVFRELFGDNMVKIDNAKELVSQGLGLVNDNVNFNQDLKGSGVSDRGNNVNINEITNKAEEVEIPTVQPAIEETTQEVIKVAEPEVETEEESTTYSDDDVEAAQAYLAKLLADAEAEALAEAEAESAAVVPVEETPVVSEEPKPATFSKSFDLDMLSALTKEIEAKDEAYGKMSDEELLKRWK